MNHIISSSRLRKLIKSDKIIYYKITDNFMEGEICLSDDKINRYVKLKSLKIVYWFTFIFLLIWAIIDLVRGNKYSIALALFCTQNLLLTFSERYYRRRISSQKESS